jgi:signal transduction histidine kinase/uncharacterized membrane protein affecting hemolysin expression
MRVRTTLRTKLMVMLVAACALVLGVACVAFVIYDRETSGQTKARTMGVLADAIAGSVAGAVAFGDAQAAKFVLEKLAAEETALAAAVYDQAGVRVAGWERGPGDALPERAAGAGPLGRVGARLVIERPVTSDGAAVGTMRLVVSTSDLDERTRQFLFIAALIFAACTLLATLASLRLHRVITSPVTELASTAAKVQETKNYSLRATSMTTDELGLLTHAFNDMLQSVEQRDAELEGHRKNLSRLVDERTAELRARTTEMRLVFDTVDQGFVTIDRAGRMAQERSARFDEWFGAPGPEATFQTHLEAKAPGFAATFQLGWEQVLDGFMPLEVTLAQMPSKLVVEGRVLQLAYTPMLEGEGLTGALVSVTDVTRVVQAEARQAAERELVAAVSRLVADRASFVDFLDETERLVRTLDDADPTHLQRGLHTIKGNSSLFGVESLAAVCHALEDELETGERPPDLELRVRRTWTSFKDRLKPFLGNDEAKVTVSRAEVVSLAHRLDQGLDPHGGARALERWLLEPVGPRLALLAQRGEVLAHRLGKAHVQFKVADGDVRGEREPMSRLVAVLVHLVRNALDHGIESSEERVATGKPAEATLTFSARSERGTMVLEFTDDGRGIDFEKVAKKAGLSAPTKEQLIEVLFSDGFSTRDAATETSGRGVGLSAVAEVVRALGGRIELDSVKAKGTTFRLVLPEASAAPARAA